MTSVKTALRTLAIGTAAALACGLAAAKNVVALFLSRGTPHTQAILPVLAENKLPLVGPSTGAMALHKPVTPWVFVEKYNREKWDFSKIAPQVAASDAQALLFIGTGVSVAEGIAAIRQAGSRAQIVTFSNNASGGFVKSLGENARGIIVTQVFPYERSLAAPIVKEAHDLAEAKGLAGVTPAMLEGFASAKVLVAALRKAGPKPTRATLQQALDTLGKIDIGGLEVSYSPTDHTGLEFVDLSIVGQDGKFRR